MTDASRLLRGTLPCLVALAVTTGFVLPANAQQSARGARTSGTPGVTRGAQWWLTALRVPGAWQAAPGQGSGVTVAVLSTGVSAATPDLTGTVTAGPDFCDCGRTAAGPFWGYEGTAVASLIAGHGHGAGGGTEGITGVAPRARILSVQVTLEYDDPLNADPAITRRLPGDIAAGIRYAVSHGAEVIALPLDPGTLGPAASGDPAAAGGSPAERAAVSYALAHDVVLIAPAGDNGASTRTVNYPAAYPGVVAVGATQRDGQLTPFTSTLSYVALTAPGSGLTVADPKGGYSTLATTDLSAALTAGVAALVRSRFPRLTAPQVARALETGTRPAGAHPAPGRGRGALDAAAAVAAAATLAAASAAHSARPPSAALATTRPRASEPGTAHLAVHPAGASALAGTLLRDLVITACALIVVLACALALIARRRRIRAARQAPSRSGQGGSHARRSQQAAARQLTTGRPGVIGRAQPRALGRGGESAVPTRVVPGSVIGTLGKPGTAHRRRTTTGQPPWEPATPPPAGQPSHAAPRARPAAPAAASGQPPAGEDAALAPWERSPDEFAAAPVPGDIPGWTPTSSGPMYLWNPNAGTSPQPAIPSEGSHESAEGTAPPA